VTVSSPTSSNALQAPVSASSGRRKPRADFYTLLLAVALVAVLLSLLFIWLYMKAAYDNKIRPTNTVAACQTDGGGQFAVVRHGGGRAV
jgi:hypothetical protein